MIWSLHKIISLPPALAIALAIELASLEQSEKSHCQDLFLGWQLKHVNPKFDLTKIPNDVYFYCDYIRR